jgi:hypothetical protein
MSVVILQQAESSLCPLCLCQYNNRTTTRISDGANFYLTVCLACGTDENMYQRCFTCSPNNMTLPSKKRTRTRLEKPGKASAVEAISRPACSAVEGISDLKRRRVEKESAAEVSVSSEDALSDEKRFRSYQTGQWAEKYKELCQYRHQNGHCVVPREYNEKNSLARWVKRQRYQYKLLHEGKASTLTEERVAALESVGFVWGSQGASWYERFNNLKAFKFRNKHCNVPGNYHDKKLATWVKCQRRQFKLHMEDTSSNITLHRIQELNDLGVEWKLRIYNKWTRPIVI